MRLLPIALCAALLALPACKKADPNSVEYQVEILKKGKNAKQKEKAADHLRRMAKEKPDAVKAGLPGMLEAMKESAPKLRADLAVVAGQLKDPAAVSALVEVIDLSVGDGGDRTTQDVNNANKEIARALGDIGDKAAVKPLVQLLKSTKNNYVRIETITALGKFKDSAAVPVLSEVATDERLETFINKKAILALAQINDPGSMPTYLKMLFAERRGVSFYPESAFGIFLLGDAANDRILAALNGEDKDLLAWAKERQVLVPAIYAKAAQIESDLQDKRAIPGLLKLLKYEDENPQYKLFVRMSAADSLGRMRAPEAVKALSAMLNEDEANTRSAYARALVQIGDKSVMPKLAECAKSGSWSAREYCLLGLVQLGGAKEATLFDGFAKDEGTRYDRECKEGVYGEVECDKEKAKFLEPRLKNIATYKKALETVGACSDDKCFENLLTHSESVVRERAAYELGRRHAAGSVPALLAAIQREVKEVTDLNPRFAAICALDWITAASPEAMAQAKGFAAALEAQVDVESTKTITQKIAEEVKRLQVKLARGGKL